MKRKTLLSLGTISLVIAPVVFVSSCGSSWQKWTKNVGQSNPTQDPTVSNFPSINTTSSNDGAQKQEPETREVSTTLEQHATGHMADLVNAYTKTIVQQANVSVTTFDINLDATSSTDKTKKIITNQFQLNMVLIDALKLKPVNNESVSDYWKRADWSKLKDYFTQIEDKAIINIHYKSKVLTLNWDCANLKQEALDSLSSAKASRSLVQLEEDPTLYSPSKGLSASGLLGVAHVGSKLINNPLVAAALEIDSNYVMNNLTLLTNLPSDTFSCVSTFLTIINDFVAQIWGLDDSKNFINNDVIGSWANDNHVVKGLYIWNVAREFTSPQNIIGASFLLQALSSKYAEVN